MGYLIDMWFLKINTKYQRTITNKWFWMFFAVVVFASFTAYAFYCTRRGYSFSGRVKIHWPKIWEMGIGCKRR